MLCSSGDPAPPSSPFSRSCEEVEEESSMGLVGVRGEECEGVGDIGPPKDEELGEGGGSGGGGGERKEGSRRAEEGPSQGLKTRRWWRGGGATGGRRTGPRGRGGNSPPGADEEGAG